MYHFFLLLCFSLFSSWTYISCPFGMRSSTISSNPIHPSKCPCAEFISAYAFLSSLNFFVPSVRNDQTRTTPDASAADNWAGLVRGDSVSPSLHSFVKKHWHYPKLLLVTTRLVSLWASAERQTNLWTPPDSSSFKPFLPIISLSRQPSSCLLIL